MRSSRKWCSEVHATSRRWNKGLLFRQRGRNHPLPGGSLTHLQPLVCLELSQEQLYLHSLTSLTIYLTLLSIAVVSRRWRAEILELRLLICT